ncbi:hypothetical protein ACA910_009365 [Epithemia clementina (nom. ined.)]
MISTATKCNALQLLAVLLVAANSLPTGHARLLGTDSGKGVAAAVATPQNGAKVQELEEGSSCTFYEVHALPEANSPVGDDTPTCTCELDNGKSFILELPSDSPSCEDLMKKKTLKSSISRVQLKKGAYIDHDKQKVVLPPGNPIDVDNTSRGRNGDLFQHHDGRSLAGSAVGTKTFLAVKIISKDNAGNPTSISQTEDVLSDRVFGTFGDQVNLKTQFEACSQGIYTVEPATVGDPVNDQYYIQNGVVTVEVDKYATEGRLANMNAAIDKLKVMFNLGSQSPRDILANYFMFCMPPDMATDNNPSQLMAPGVATTGGWQSCYRGDWCTFPSTQMHEIGHLHYLGHASENGAAYGDNTGAMGAGSTQQEYPKFCFNAGHMYDLGWYAPSGLVEITSPPTGNLDIDMVGFVKPFASGITLVKIVNPLYAGTPDTKNIYLHVNQQIDHNQGTLEAGNLVTVVAKVEDPGSWTFLIGKMNARSTIQVPGFFSASCVLNISVTTLKLSRNQVTVRVQNVC